LLHLIDVTQDDPIAAYHTIQRELSAYGRDLGDRPQILALNKIDALAAEPETIEAIANQFRQLTHAPVFTLSAVTRTGIDALLQHIWDTLEALAVTAAPEPAPTATPDATPSNPQAPS
jgi:GTP-binding protein